jgi:hypothetical protein
MTLRHNPVEFIAGDTWEIQATLLEENGDPLNLTDPSAIDWTLLDRRQQRVINGEAIIVITDGPAGKCSITIPASISSGIAPGSYTDALRVTIAMTVGTLFYGTIQVRGDPWRAPTQAGAVCTV